MASYRCRRFFDSSHWRPFDHCKGSEYRSGCSLSITVRNARLCHKYLAYGRSQIGGTVSRKRCDQVVDKRPR